MMGIDAASKIAITNRIVIELTLPVCFAPIKLPIMPVIPITASTDTSKFVFTACPRNPNIQARTLMALFVPTS
jgi:hypothetical protein